MLQLTGKKRSAKRSTLAGVLSTAIFVHMATLLPHPVTVTNLPPQISACTRPSTGIDEDEDLEEREEEVKWVEITGGPFKKSDKICADLRRLQQRSGCSDVACEDILSTFRKYLGIDAPTNFRQYDKDMRKHSGAEMLRLNGCSNCKRHVYLPSDKDKVCPRCGHSRYDAKGVPLEVCIFFVLHLIKQRV